MREDIPVLECVAGEYGFPFTLNCYDADNAAMSFVGDETITLGVKVEGGVATTIGVGTFLDAAGGIVRITLAAADVAKLPRGVYLAQLKVATAAKVLYSRAFRLRVGEAIA